MSRNVREEGTVIEVGDDKHLNQSNLSSSSSRSYERLKVVGKGAFGTAVLCKRYDDGQYVIVKEIPMLALSAGERQMALNEAKVLAKLNHPNIIRYHDSYEVDGTLMIEMEYADGGNLQEYLSRLEIRMDEKTVLNYFQQITSAVLHLHEKRILHRDLKTANIFMTAELMIKVGDFGISKAVSTQATKANTVIGTPYYISPEMCEGKPYNDKSDIWALGCIVYEMACLHRTFDASNLPALVNKITKGHFAPIDGEYSHEFRELIRDMLHQEAAFRPSAKDIVQIKLPELVKQLDQQKSKMLSQNLQQAGILKKRSILYFVKHNECFLELIPVPLPPRIVVQQLAVSLDHMLVLTVDTDVYAWGNNAKGQLGLDSLRPYVEHPVLVPYLSGKSVKMIGAGDGFSIFSCNNGIVMTCGDGSKGCLGHSDFNSTLKPKVLEKLLCINVTAIACGSNHVVIIGDEQWAFSWGLGSNGRLGHGNEETTCLPMEIDFREKVVIKKVYCGFDGTLFITDKGKVWACGSNAHNKLGLNSAGQLMSLKNKCIDQVFLPTRVKISRSVVDASLGINHSAFLLDNGNVVTCGLNEDGQLGRGHKQNDDRTIGSVQGLGDTRIIMVSCANTFTIVGSSEHVVLCWGGRYVDPKRCRSISTRSKSLVYNVTTSAEEISNLNVKDEDNSTRSVEVAPPVKKLSLTPVEILVLYASPSQISKGEIIALSGLHSQGNQLYFLISTTTPVPHRASCKNSPFCKKSNKASKNIRSKSVKNDGKSDGEQNSTVPIPRWLEKELEESDDVWQRVASVEKQ